MLGQVHIADDMSEEDLRDKEQQVGVAKEYVGVVQRYGVATSGVGVVKIYRMGTSGVGVVNDYGLLVCGWVG